MYVFLSVVLYLVVGILLGFMMCMESKESLYNDFKKEILPSAFFWLPIIAWYVVLGVAVLIMYVFTYAINSMFEAVNHKAEGC